MAPAELAELRQILARTLPGRTFRIFGSRVRGTARRFSDLDLLIDGERLTLDELAELRDSLTDSNLPFRVDLVEAATLSPSFRAAVLAEAIPLP